MWNLKKKKKKEHTQKRRSDLWSLEVESGGGGTGKGGQKVQTFSYKINKSWDIMYNTITLTLLYDIFDSH